MYSSGMVRLNVNEMLHDDGILEERQIALSVASSKLPLIRAFGKYTTNEDVPPMTSHEAAMGIQFAYASLLSNLVAVEAPQLHTGNFRRSISQDVSLVVNGVHCNTEAGWILTEEGATFRRAKSCQSLTRLSKAGSTPVNHYSTNQLNVGSFKYGACEFPTYNPISQASANLYSYRLRRYASIKYQGLPLLQTSTENQAVYQDEPLLKYLINVRDLDIGRDIGIGSSAIVYEGLYRQHQKVAIKVLKAFDGSEGQFQREILVLSSCRHQNILGLVGACLDSRRRQCIITKFMEGGSLHDYLQRKQKLPPKEILRLAVDIAKGMQYLHSKGVIHMDLKTSNILLGDDGSAVIGDVASARFSNENQDLRKDIGTYRWMAPEVFGAVEAGKDVVTSKSDVYSFGILLWELVSCKVPYADYTPVQAAAGVVMNELRPTIPKDCYPPFKCIIQKCWSQKPTDRPSFSQILKMLKIVSTHCST